MIRLTHTSGKSVYIMPENIVDFFQTDTGDTLITFVAGHGYRVKDSPEEVARKVLEYKLEMNRHRLGLVKKDELFRLAGLEEQKDATKTSD